MSKINEETVEETTEDVVETTQEETVESKPTESDEDRKSRLTRQLKQVNKKLGVEDKPKPTSKSNDSDLGEKAFLRSNDIKEADEIALVNKLKKETGKAVDSLMETTYFQTELKALRENRATSDAIPSNGKRSNNSAVDTVEYWIAKGELPKDTELKRKVINHRMKKEESKGQFYNS